MIFLWFEGLSRSSFGICKDLIFHNESARRADKNINEHHYTRYHLYSFWFGINMNGSVGISLQTVNLSL